MRQEWFERRKDFADTIRSMPMFEGLQPGVADLFAETTLRPASYGKGYQLRCPREYESCIFEYSFAYNFEPKAHDIACPIKVIGGDPTVPLSFYQAWISPVWSVSITNSCPGQPTFSSLKIRRSAPISCWSSLKIRESRRAPDRLARFCIVLRRHETHPAHLCMLHAQRSFSQPPRSHTYSRPAFSPRSGLSVFLLAALSLVLAACGAVSTPAIDSDDIGGVVTGANGPEAGVWVIAETGDLPTPFVKIVVTDDAGRYVLPDLPEAEYEVWVRGYGLVDSPGSPVAPAMC